MSESGACQAGCGGGVPPVPLTSLKAGEGGVVCETCLEPSDAAMLRAMGLSPSARVKVCRTGEPTVIEVVGANRVAGGGFCEREGGCRCRLGLTRFFASRVMVQVATRAAGG